LSDQNNHGESHRRQWAEVRSIPHCTIEVMPKVALRSQGLSWSTCSKVTPDRDHAKRGRNSGQRVSRRCPG
jgi:hypothetical protein